MKKVKKNFDNIHQNQAQGFPGRETESNKANNYKGSDDVIEAEFRKL